MPQFEKLKYLTSIYKTHSRISRHEKVDWNDLHIYIKDALESKLITEKEISEYLPPERVDLQKTPH